MKTSPAGTPRSLKADSSNHESLPCLQALMGGIQIGIDPCNLEKIPGAQGDGVGSR